MVGEQINFVSKLSISFFTSWDQLKLRPFWNFTKEWKTPEISAVIIPYVSYWGIYYLVKGYSNFKGLSCHLPKSVGHQTSLEVYYGGLTSQVRWNQPGFEVTYSYLGRVSDGSDYESLTQTDGVVPTTQLRLR